MDATKDMKPKRGYAIYAVYKDRENYGERYERDEQLFELPAIGSTVVVTFLHINPKSRGKELVKTIYKPDPVFCDEMKRPLTFVVVGYSEGIDNPLSTKNKIYLERDLGGGRRIRKSIMAVQVARGSVRMEPVEDGRLYGERGYRQVGEHGAKSKYKNQDIQKMFGDSNARKAV